MTVASLDPSRPLPLPAFCETCTWPLRSYSDLSCGERRVSVGDWPMHGRFHESFRVALPVRLGFRNWCSSWQVSLAFSKFVEACLPHQMGPRLVVRGLPHVPVVVVSNGLTPGRAQEHVVNSRLGPVHSVLEKH